MAVTRRNMSAPLTGREKNGFTLIESVVAMGIFAGAVFLLVTVFNGFLLNDFPSRTSKAVALAQSRLEFAEAGDASESSDVDTLGFYVKTRLSGSDSMETATVEVTSMDFPKTVAAVLTNTWRIR